MVTASFSELIVQTGDYFITVMVISGLSLFGVILPRRPNVPKGRGCAVPEKAHPLSLGFGAPQGDIASPVFFVFLNVLNVFD